MWNLITMDGFFEGPKSWELDWHDSVWGDELEKYAIEQSKSTGMLLFGRVTYEGMAEQQHRSEEHTSELQSLRHLVCRLLLEKKNKQNEHKKQNFDAPTILSVAKGDSEHR